MFSIQTHIQQLRYLVIIGILGGLIFAPNLAFPTVHAAGNQPNTAAGIDDANADLKNTIGIKESEAVSVINEMQSETMMTVSNSITQRPETWKTWNVVPSLSQNAISIYKRGLAMGNNPHAFSKIGDGEISAAWFLTAFDQGPRFYDLGPYTDLQPTIDYFAGSFQRQGMAARRGFNAQQILDPSLADPRFCQTNESPLNCELRLHNPSFALISMGTNQVWQPVEFERGLRKLLKR